MKFEPCVEHCWFRFGKQYSSEECDDTCNYAGAILESRQKDKIIELLLDMLEDEHMGMRSKAVEAVKTMFGVEI